MLYILKKIVNIFRKKPPVWAKASDDVIEYAFTAGGVAYFRFADPFRLPTHRAFAALSAYEALEMRCTRDFLLSHLDAVEKALNAHQYATIAQLTGVLRERLNWIIEPETVYQLAAVVFFDAQENPYRYDAAYNQKKILYWQKHGVQDFFYTAPLANWLPCSGMPPELLKEYCTAATLHSRQHRKFHTMQPSNNPPAAPPTMP